MGNKQSRQYRAPAVAVADAASENAQYTQDALVKLVSFGFVRKFQRKQHSLRIPTEIYEIVREFYGFYHLEFIETTGIHHKLNGKCIIHKSNVRDLSWSTSLLHKTVSSGTHRWEFKIHNVNKAVILGLWKVDSDDHEAPTRKLFTIAGDKGYGYNVCYACKSPDSIKDYAVKCKANDVVVMVLDLQQRTLEFTVNGKNYGICYSVQAGSYKAAISTLWKFSSVEFVSYQQCK